jgi:hypothetical protein
MQRQKLNTDRPPYIVAPTTPVSLIGGGWRCLHREAWETQHNEFYAKNNIFSQNTIWSLGAQKSKLSKSFEASASMDHWIIEKGKNLSPVGRVALQVFKGNYGQGLLFLDLSSDCLDFGEEMIGQLITLPLLNNELVMLKLIASSPSTDQILRFLEPAFTTHVITFSKSHLALPQKQITYQIDPDHWFESSLGQKSLVSLNWLKKRKDRERSIRAASKKNKRKRPLLFSLLTLGRSRRV